MTTRTKKKILGTAIALSLLIGLPLGWKHAGSLLFEEGRACAQDGSCIRNTCTSDFQCSGPCVCKASTLDPTLRCRSK